MSVGALLRRAGKLFRAAGKLALSCCCGPCPTAQTVCEFSPSHTAATIQLVFNATYFAGCIPTPSGPSVEAMEPDMPTAVCLAHQGGCVWTGSAAVNGDDGLLRIWAGSSCQSADDEQPVATIDTILFKMTRRADGADLVAYMPGVPAYLDSGGGLGLLLFRASTTSDPSAGTASWSVTVDNDSNPATPVAADYLLATSAGPMHSFACCRPCHCLVGSAFYESLPSSVVLSGHATAYDRTTGAVTCESDFSIVCLRNSVCYFESTAPVPCLGSSSSLTIALVDFPEGMCFWTLIGAVGYTASDKEGPLPIGEFPDQTSKFGGTYPYAKLSNLRVA